MNNGNDAQIEIIGGSEPHSISSLMTCLFSCGGHDANTSGTVVLNCFHGVNCIV